MMILSILMAFVQYTHYMLLEVLDVLSQCVVAEQSVTATNSSPIVPTIASSPCTVPAHLPPRRDHHMVCMYSCTWLPILWRAMLLHLGGQKWRRRQSPRKFIPTSETAQFCMLEGYKVNSSN